MQLYFRAQQNLTFMKMFHCILNAIPSIPNCLQYGWFLWINIDWLLEGKVTLGDIAQQAIAFDTYESVFSMLMLELPLLFHLATHQERILSMIKYLDNVKK